MMMETVNFFPTYGYIMKIYSDNEYTSTKSVSEYHVSCMGCDTDSATFYIHDDVFLNNTCTKILKVKRSQPEVIKDTEYAKCSGKISGFNIEVSAYKPREPKYKFLIGQRFKFYHNGKEHIVRVGLFSNYAIFTFLDKFEYGNLEIKEVKCKILRNYHYEYCYLFDEVIKAKDFI